jgi:hypothetical protein
MVFTPFIRMLDGIDGGNTGVMVLHDGKIAAAIRSSIISRLHQRQRQMEGRTRQPRALAEPGRAAGVRRL